MTSSPVSRTVEVSDLVMVDLDEFNVVVGIEMLAVDAEIPFQRLIDELHVHSADVEMLRVLRPSIGAKLERGADGAAEQSPALEPAPTV